MGAQNRKLTTMDVPDTPAISQTLPDVKNIDQFFRVDHIKADLKRRTVRGGAVTVVSQLVRQILSIASTVAVRSRQKD